MYANRGLHPVLPRHQIRQFRLLPLHNLPTGHLTDVQFESLTDDNMDDMIQYDQQVCGWNRRQFWSVWLAKESCAAYVARRQGRVVGFGLLALHRDAHYRFEPLFADDQTIARHLIKKLTTGLPDNAVFAADFSMESHVLEILEDILPKGFMDDLGYTLTTVATGSPNIIMDKSKLYFYTQVDTVPI